MFNGIDVSNPHQKFDDEAYRKFPPWIKNYIRLARAEAKAQSSTNNKPPARDISMVGTDTGDDGSTIATQQSQQPPSNGGAFGSHSYKSEKSSKQGGKA